VPTARSKPELSPSPSIGDLLAEPATQLALDNDVRLRVAESMAYLRRFRGWTQQRVAELSGVSQPKVANVEGGDANITLRTLERMITALAGRLHLSVQPAELRRPAWTPWWDEVDFSRSTSGTQFETGSIVLSSRIAPASDGIAVFDSQSTVEANSKRVLTVALQQAGSEEPRPEAPTANDNLALAA
jgi:transcriptional regulator with XRE-family HTH domain